MTGLDATFRLLAKSKNEAALPWLIAGLDSAQCDMRNRAVRALLARHSPAGHRELLHRWHQLDESQLKLIDENSDRLSAAIRDGVLSLDAELNRNACDAAIRLRDYDLIPTLVNAAEDTAHPHALQAAQAVVALAEHLSSELSAPRDYRNRRDPALIRQYVFGSLGQSVRNFSHHRHTELIEAYLLLVNKDDTLLKQILDDPDAPVYAAVVRLLTSSDRTGVIRVALDSLEEVHTPAAILHVLTRRKDEPFVHRLLLNKTKRLSPHCKCNLRKVESWAWLRDDMSILHSLSDEQLCAAVLLTTGSAMNRARALEVVRFALDKGGVLSRRAATAALLEFKGNESNEMVMLALGDSDPEVQTHAVSQLRDRGIPGVRPLLTALLDSPHNTVRAAVREALSEFKFQRFLSAFDRLDLKDRIATGALVKRVDTDAIGQLQVELTSVSRSRRLRGLEIAVAMQATREVEEEILALSCDNDHFVRVATIPALLRIDSEKTRQRLQELRMDRAASVQDAAEEALGRIISVPDPFASFSGPPVDAAPGV